MDSRTITIGTCKLEVLAEGERFLGLGRVWIGETLARSGRLPLRPWTQAFTGWGLDHLRLLGVDAGADNIRIRTEAVFTPLPIKMLRDHSLDPIHETGDWDAPETRVGRLDVVLAPAADRFGPHEFTGFAYHYEYSSDEVPLFFLHDGACRSRSPSTLYSGAISSTCWRGRWFCTANSKGIKRSRLSRPSGWSERSSSRWGSIDTGGLSRSDAMKKWAVLLLCGMVLGIGLLSVAQEVSGDPAGTESPAAPGLGGGWVSMLMLFAVFGAIFYFMLIRPQRKRQTKMNELIGGLKRGDPVVTAGGIYGEIDSIGDTAAVLILEDGAKLKVAKSSIVQKREK